jgi:hypothetical protein
MCISDSFLLDIPSLISGEGGYSPIVIDCIKFHCIPIVVIVKSHPQTSEIRDLKRYKEQEHRGSEQAAF